MGDTQPALALLPAPLTSGSLPRYSAPTPMRTMIVATRMWIPWQPLQSTSWRSGWRGWSCSLWSWRRVRGLGPGHVGLLWCQLLPWTCRDLDVCLGPCQCHTDSKPAEAPTTSPVTYHRVVPSVNRSPGTLCAGHRMWETNERSRL